MIFPHRVKRGFSLAETLIVMTLVSIFLVVLAALFSSFNTARRASSDKESNLAAAFDTFETVGNDLSSAIRIISPTTAWSSLVRLDRLTPYDQTRFTAPLLSPTAPWHIHSATTQEHITYNFSAPKLTRIKVLNGITTTSVVAVNLNFFQCRLVATGGTISDANLQLTVLRNGVAQVINHSVSIHLPPGGLDP